MKLIKAIGTLICCSSLMVTSAQAATCCEKANADGKECTHKCCITAHKESKSCEKCNPGKQDLKLKKKDKKDAKKAA